MIRLVTAFFMCCAGLVQALDFPSNANLQVEEINPLGSYDMPVGIWNRGVMPMQSVEGRLLTQAWRIAALP